MALEYRRATLNSYFNMTRIRHKICFSNLDSLDSVQGVAGDI